MPVFAASYSIFYRDTDIEFILPREKPPEKKLDQPGRLDSTKSQHLTRPVGVSLEPPNVQSATNSKTTLPFVQPVLEFAPSARTVESISN